MAGLGYGEGETNRGHCGMCRSGRSCEICREGQEEHDGLGKPGI